jgi:hypothetical protein
MLFLTQLSRADSVVFVILFLFFEGIRTLSKDVNTVPDVHLCSSLIDLGFLQGLSFCVVGCGLVAVEGPWLELVLEQMVVHVEIEVVAVLAVEFGHDGEQGRFEEILVALLIRFLLVALLVTNMIFGHREQGV